MTMKAIVSRSRLLAAAVLLGLLSGCVSMKGLEPQGRLTEPDRLQSHRSLAGAKLTPAAWPRSDWWTALGDPQLDELVAEALQGSPSLEVADARVRVALAQAGAKDADRKPKVGGEAQYSGIYIPKSLAPEPIGGKYFGLEALMLSGSWSPDLFGGHRAAWEAAVDQAHAAQVDAQAARLMLSTNIVQAYVELAHLTALGDVANRELERSRKTRSLVAQRVKAGIDNALQQRQADAAVATAERGVQMVGQQIQLERAALAALVGKGPDRGLDIHAPKPLSPAQLALPAELPSDLLARRPDVVAARWRVEAASKGIQAMKAQFYPSINLSAMGGLASGKLEDLLSPHSLFAQIGPSISLPIFDGGRLRAGLAEKDANYDVAVAQYDQTLVDALHQVAEQVIALRWIEAQIATQQRVQDAAQAAYDLGLQRFHGGVAGLLDALNVQQALLRSEQQMADLQSQRIAASVRLAQALGGGFQPDAPPPVADPAPAPSH